MAMDAGETIAWMLVADALAAPFVGLRHGHIQQLAGGEVEGYLANPILYPEKPEKNTLPGLHSGLGQAVLAARFSGEVAQDSAALKLLHSLKELAGEDPESEALGSLRHVPLTWRRALLAWRKNWAWEAEDFRRVGESLQEGHGAVLALAAVASEDMPTEDLVLLLESVTARPLSIFAALFVAEFFRVQRREPVADPEGLRAQLVRVSALIREQEKAHALRRAKEWREIGWGAPTVSAADIFSPLPSLIREANDDLAIRTLLQGATALDPAFTTSQPQHGHPAVGLPWALFRAFDGRSPRRILEEIINRGGEAPLCATIAAAFLSLRYSNEAIPEEWWSRLRAGAMLRPGVSRQKWIAWEQGATIEEEEMRRPLRQALVKERQEAIEKGKLKPKAKPVAQEDAPFAPPPHLWLKPGEEEDPSKKRILKEARGKKRIDWKEERRKGDRRQD